MKKIKFNEYSLRKQLVILGLIAFINTSIIFWITLFVSDTFFNGEYKDLTFGIILLVWSLIVVCPMLNFFFEKPKK
jgi:O-antigen/teichoic acid export membrane protein